MTAEDPQQGSFRTYAKKAYGRWAGFCSGWVYWSSELLIMGSQLTALSLFTRFWLHNVPMWLLASGYAALGLIVILPGTKAFEGTENVFAIIKISAIFMFFIVAAMALLGFIQGSGPAPRLPVASSDIFPGGGLGVWSSFIYAFYVFGGIEIMGLMAARLKKPDEAPKAGKIMIMLLAAIYTASLILALTLVPLDQMQGKDSPFQFALNSYPIPLIPHSSDKPRIMKLKMVGMRKLSYE